MSFLSQVKVQDSTGAVVAHPAEDESVVLLRRLVKVLESNANVDNLGRQRVVIEATGAALATVPTVSISAGQTVATVTSLSQLSGFASWMMLADNANAQYARALRPRFTW